MRRDAEVNHLTDWSLWEWLWHFAIVAALPAALLFLALAVFTSLDWFSEFHRPWPIRALGIALPIVTAVVVAVGLLWHFQSTVMLLRHASSFWWSLASVVLVVVCVLVLVSALILFVYEEISPKISTRTENYLTKGLLAGTGIYGLVALGVDALHRAAAAVSLTVGAFVIVVVVGAGLFVAWARSN